MKSQATLKGKALDLKRLIGYSKASVVSQTLINKPAGTLTLFAFDAGQGLSEHTAPYDAIAQILEGEAELTIGGQRVKAPAGRTVIMPARVSHAVQAVTKFKMLLTMIR